MNNRLLTVSWRESFALNVWKKKMLSIRYCKIWLSGGVWTVALLDAKLLPWTIKFTHPYYWSVWLYFILCYPRLLSTQLGFLMFACLRLYIPVIQCSMKQWANFYMYILCVRGVKVARCVRMYSNRNFLGDWIFCALSLLLYSLLHSFCNDCIKVHTF